MKKFTITLSSLLFLTASNVYAQEYIFPVLPIGCSVQPQPCSQPCPATCSTPAVTTCAEVQEWKIKYFEKRCALYTQLGLSQEQRIQAKAIDERFFDEIAPLKACCKNERAKYNEMKCQKCNRADRHAQKDKIKDLKSEIKDKKKQHIKCFEEILTSCQKNAYKKYKKQDLKCSC